MKFTRGICRTLRENYVIGLSVFVVCGLAIFVVIRNSENYLEKALLAQETESQQLSRAAVLRFREWVDGEVGLLEANSRLAPENQVEGFEILRPLFKAEPRRSSNLLIDPDLIEQLRFALEMRESRLFPNLKLDDLVQKVLDDYSRLDQEMIEIQKRFKVTPTILADLLGPSRPRSGFETLYYDAISAERNGDQERAKNLYAELELHQTVGERDLYLKIISQLNLIRMTPERSSRRVFHVLYLLEKARNMGMSTARHQFLMEKLEELVPPLDQYQEASDLMWRRAREIEIALGSFDSKPPVIFEEHKILIGSGDVVEMISFTPEEVLRSVSEGIVYRETQPQDSGVFEKIFPDTSSIGYLGFEPAVLESKSDALRKSAYISRATYSGAIVLLGLGILYLYSLSLREKELARLRGRFVSTVSHELRTPLTLIKMFSETLLLNRVKEEDCQTYLNTIVAETDRMTGLVNNIIDYSRQTSGQQRLRPVRVDLSKLCDEISGKFRYRFELENVQFDSLIEADVVATLDAQAFEQVLFNLIDNAIKYTLDEKSISLELKRDSSGAEIRVTDNGIGIPEYLHEVVFEEFFRIDHEHVLSQRGSGIGLYVVRSTLSDMGCAISLHDVEKGGTEVRIRIPKELL